MDRPERNRPPPHAVRRLSAARNRSLRHYPVGLTIGGIGRRPGVVRANGAERIEVREFPSLTVSFDHDVIDGAPAARFVARLEHLIEHGTGLRE